MKAKEYIALLGLGVGGWHVEYLPPFLDGVHVGPRPAWRICRGPGCTPSVWNCYVAPASIDNFFDAEVDLKGYSVSDLLSREEE